MIENFFDWYENRVNEFECDSALVWNNGNHQFDEYRKDGGIINLDGLNFIYKQTHSKYYKNNRGEFQKLPNACKLLDNRLALTSELISRKKYREFGFMYAKQYPHFKGFQYYIISPNLLQGYCDYCTYYEILKNPYDDRAQEQKVFKRTTYGTFKQLLKKKKLLLSVMTEDCFDQYVKYFLSSIFEFSDDEHFNNVIFCKNRGSDKFESIFVFDKESTVFNPMIARGDKFGDIKFQSLTYYGYVGRSVVCVEENIGDRMIEIGKLIKKGILEKKYVDFLNQLANFDFGKLAQDFYNEYGRQIHPVQLDMYKFGADLAGDTAQMQ